MHKFSKRMLDDTACVTCNRPEIDHTPNATCESCSTITSCEIFGSPTNPKAMLLCEACTIREIEANTSVINRIATQTTPTYKNLFNFNTPKIIALKSMHDLSDEQLNLFIQNQIEQFQVELFDDLKTRIIENPHAKLVIELRAEVRQQISSTDIDYHPPSKAPKVNTKSITPKPTKKSNWLDTMAMHYIAKQAKQGNIITLEQAKEIINRGIEGDD